MFINKCNQFFLHIVSVSKQLTRFWKFQNFRINPLLLLLGNHSWFFHLCKSRSFGPIKQYTYIPCNNGSSIHYSRVYLSLNALNCILFKIANQLHFEKWIIIKHWQIIYRKYTSFSSIFCAYYLVNPRHNKN